ncbi:unnamed protein product [Allacma fusca]|uniref:DnaJ homolog subfamily C member 1 n=1 Tax=Allacma fusca TaxID=39272 RepID=A0A8J2NLB3_9HEXA|nr:unnamed protein product [Allacma fusca]
MGELRGRDSSLWLLLLTGLVLLDVGAMAWSNEEYDMFDLVEEVGQNFYEVLGVTPDATDKDVRSAYRKLSVKIHPDKNPAEDAEVKFRQLVGIYEVLKNKELRESYERVLVEGLPNWRQPIFYFRRARRLAMWQVGVLLLGIISIGQYLAGWASYFEKRLSMKEQIEARLRKTHRTKKGQKEGPTVEELEAEMELYLPKPSLWNLAPFQLCYGVKYLVVQAPFDFMEYRERLRQEEAEKLRLEEIENERLEKERLKAEEPKKPRKRKTFQPQERSEVDEVEVQPVWNIAEDMDKSRKNQPKKPPVISGGLWTDDDLTELARLCSKFPGGTPQRWETIAEFLNRPVPEVTFMAKKVLEKLASKPAEDELEVPQVKVKVKTKGGKADGIAAAGSAPDAKNAENWSADEQKALEYALQCYPKGSNERWEKIALMVPNRTKDECMLRFKYVADLVKKKKEPKQEEEPKQETVQEPQPELPKSDILTPSTSQMADSQSWEPVKVKTKPKKKSKPESAAPAEKPAVEILSTQIDKQQSPSEVPVIAQVLPVTETPAEPPAKEPLSALETSVEDQLQSLLEESLHEPTAATKEPLQRSDSKSSIEGESLVMVRRRGSKECSVERKNSSSSENDWCVIDEEPSQ